MNECLVSVLALKSLIISDFKNEKRENKWGNSVGTGALEVSHAFMFVKQSVWLGIECLHSNRTAIREETSCTRHMLSAGGTQWSQFLAERNLHSIWKDLTYIRSELKVIWLIPQNAFKTSYLRSCLMVKRVLQLIMLGHPIC